MSLYYKKAWDVSTLKVGWCRIRDFLEITNSNDNEGRDKTTKHLHVMQLLYPLHQRARYIRRIGSNQIRLRLPLI